jgi:predicted PurR-regulated permease PerM
MYLFYEFKNIIIIIIIIIIICHVLNAVHLHIHTWNKPRLLGIQCCSFLGVHPAHFFTGTGFHPGGKAIAA